MVRCVLFFYSLSPKLRAAARIYYCKEFLHRKQKDDTKVVRKSTSDTNKLMLLRLLFSSSSSSLSSATARAASSIPTTTSRYFCNPSSSSSYLSSRKSSNTNNNKTKKKRAKTLMTNASSKSSNTVVDERTLSTDIFFLDDFAIRQWDDPNYSGTIIAHDKIDFVRKIHDYHTSSSSGEHKLVDGYAPFCKHVFVPNFVNAKVATVEITKENEHLLKSGYSARSENELAVLTRWFHVNDIFGDNAEDIKTSKMLDIILYSREQLVKEREATGKADPNRPLPDAPWGIISIKAQDEPFELPMQPITMMRNALGKSEGGSGVPLEKSKYDASVAYWRNHAPLLKTDTPNGD